MTINDLAFLESQPLYPSVSIFIATHRRMPGRESDPIAVKNALSEVKERLSKEQDLSEEEMKPVLDNLQKLADAIDYDQMRDGLALFANPVMGKMFILPVPVKTKVIIEHAFAVSEVMNIVSRIPHYWALVLGEKPTRLFYGHGDLLTEVIEPENDAMGVSRDGFPLDYIRPEINENEIHMTTHRVWNSPVDSQYFDDHKRKFFTKIEHLLTRFTERDQYPLFVVGTEHDVTLFKDVHAKDDVAKVIPGFYASRGVREIEELVYPAVLEYLDDERHKKIAELAEARGRKQLARGIRDVWEAAKAGRIRELLVEDNYVVNKVDDILSADEATSFADDNFVDNVVEEVLSKGDARVTFCKPGELKDHLQIAAILRY